MKELIKIIFVFTFFTLSLSQFYKFYPEQGIYDVPERDEKECGKCPNYECDNITKICTDNETDCMEAKTYGQNCTEPCSGLPYHCVLCSRSGKECLECPNNESWGIHCNESCKRCPGGKCLINDGKCSEDAPYCDDPTYHDEYCNTSCNITTPNCETCLKANGECTKCKHSYFTKNCNSQCEFCPDKDCDFDGICNDTESDCIDMKKRGEACNEDCNWDDSEHCVQCHRNGTCVFCEENKFWDPNCTKPCDDHCPDNSECEIDGFCSNEEDNCHNNLTYGNYCLTYCNDTRDNCITCNRKGICLTCLDNKTYGENCEYSCEKCPEGLCDIDGVCLDPKGNCLNNLTFGPSCNESCSNISISCSTCNRNETCIECIDQTVFGEHCNKTCNCPGPKCEIDGTCVDYSGKCINDSFYGKKCDERCDKDRPNCVLCDIFGKCSQCSNETYFGENCTDICDHCPGRKCYIDGSCIDTNGTCPDNHLYGPNCDIRCDQNNTNCDTCLRDGTCDSCKTLFNWGPKCDNTCKFCPNETCINNGTCTDTNSNCVNETHFGSECNNSCSEVNDDCKLCNRIGKCLECVNNTIFGDTCNETCNNCPINGTDNYGYCFINGTCYNQIDSCTDEHYTGENCSVSCNSNHTYCDTCDREGICIDCNNHTKFGQYCEDSCDKCPKNDTEEFGYCFINGTCYNKIDLCTDEHYTGENCSVLCNSSHTYCNTCDRGGFCFNCTNITKFGPYCEDSCERCPNLIKFESLEVTSEDQALCFMNGTCKNQIDVCKDKMFTGETCNEKCDEINKKTNCLECDRKNICSKCKNESFFGINCTQECNNCPGEPGECDVSGDCKDLDTKCKNSIYTGNNCSVLCNKTINENCHECDRKGNCTDCLNKIYTGNNCNVLCNETINENCHECDINGTCFDCFNKTKFGNKCNDLCNKTIDENCHECDINGICLDCFNKIYTGNKCNDLCNETINENCHECDIKGNCLDCFNKTKFGNKCNNLCIEKINENCYECDMEGNCLDCLNKTKFGNKCNISCSNCPIEKDDQRLCHINGSCYNQKDICYDDTKTGEFCDEACSNISNTSKYCKTCNREKKCTSCTDLKHSGDDCLNECKECGEEGCNIKGYCKEFKCANASYGLGCDKNCSCKSNSNDETCGKFRGQCSSCKFGYFGNNCTNSCDFKCQTELCCIFKEYKNDNFTRLKVTTSYKTIEIKIGGKPYTFEIDYNYGFPLTIFNNKTTLDYCGDNIEKIDYGDYSSTEEFHERFTNYDILSYFKNDVEIIIGDLSIKTDIAIAHKCKCLSKEEMKGKINGVIGLGFFNSISNAIFTDSNLDEYKLNILNILSFNYIAEGDQIEMLFGDLFEEQRDYVERLTSCKVILDGKSDIQEKKMTCQLDGIKASKYSEAFKLNNSFITFSLGEKSSLILGNNSNYLEYLKRAFFNNDTENYELKDDPINKGIQYILYPNDKINKLSDIGFVFNNFSYSYPPNKFFENNVNSNDAEEKSQFLIKINKNSDRTEFIIGKEFFSDIKFTINNEEAQIYFYAQNAQYCDKFTDVISDSLFNIKLDARAISAICLAILVFIYLAAFTIYFFVKRKKMKSGDYIRIE